MNAIRWLVLCLSAAQLQGCASPLESPDAASRTVLMQSPSDAIVLLPLNVTAVMPERLEAVSPRIWEELQVYLQAHGAKLKTLSFPAARKLWIESIAEVRSQGAKTDFADAARSFVARVARHAEFATVVVPSLFVQGAEVEGRTAAWDGVERALSIDEGRWAGEVPEDTPFGGSLPAASLHAVVLDAEGRVLQERQAGLALLVSVRLGGRPGLGPPSFQVEEIAAPFEDRGAILEGIARALAPFLTPLEPRHVLEHSRKAP